ncbi:MAG: serine dehydratase subunit alpha family protein [Paludibacteraceae bacterium]|nr:serine dehydratase subunit alpha family protein [Paludibacteraceae bacterium]
MNTSEILALLHREVVPAIGCTEPMCVALCVARATEQLGGEPDAISVSVSKNIYKNAMGVGIPCTGMNGLPIAVALGATIGKSAYGLEVLRDTTPEAVAYAKSYMQRVPPQITIAHDAPDILYVHATVSRNGKTACATIQGSHTCFVDDSPSAAGSLSAEGGLISSLREVYDFALNVPLREVEFLMEGAKMNMSAAEKSFMGNYGHGLGRLLHTVSNQHLTGVPTSLRGGVNANSPHTQMSNIFGDTLFTKILCYTCGACDARMSGAMVPVMSNSGSGNQGISCSIPVYLYALEHNMNEEQTLRALTLSNLTVVYIKQSLGRLSALCGCVVAATGSAAGLTYLMGGQFDEVTFAIKNMIANISGMICDGAKPACALKVTSGVATAVLSASMAMHHSFAEATEGIVEDDIDRTIHNLTRIGRDGMCKTDDLIIDIMTNKNQQT